jgi:hypothetical protein
VVLRFGFYFLSPLWFVFDHLPSEYLRHLEACKNRQATTPATKVHKAITTSEWS